MKPLTFNSCQWPRQNFSILQHTINQISDENKVKYQFGDRLIRYQILWTNILIIVWLTVRRITNLIWQLNGWAVQLLSQFKQQGDKIWFLSQRGQLLLKDWNVGINKVNIYFEMLKVFEKITQGYLMGPCQQILHRLETKICWQVNLWFIEPEWHDAGKSEKNKVLWVFPFKYDVTSTLTRTNFIAMF